MKDWQKWLAGLLIGFFSGVCTMQATLVKESNTHTVKIEQLEKSEIAIKTDFEKRMDQAFALWKETNELVRQQNFLLSKKQ